MQVLLVADLHYDLRKLDWVLEHCGDVDVLVVAGDILDVGSGVPLDAQIAVSLEYLARFAGRTATVACSGNHDLDHRTDSGEKATGWLADARPAGVTVDGDSLDLGDWTFTSCAWWEGPETLARLEASLAEAARRRRDRWAWVYHGPLEGPLSWTGRQHFGDPELPRLLDRHAPEVVLGGHVHQAPFVDGGAWVENRHGAWLFNAGYQPGPLPAHVFVDLDSGAASWWSLDGSGEKVLDRPLPGGSPAAVQV